MLCSVLALYSCQEHSSNKISVEETENRNIRTSDPLSAEEERLSLHLPPGFEAQLFAAEPDIAKPLNMSFDERGRMWVTQSYEYPFADTTGVGKDKISILEDTTGDGKADKITVFADSLNIPIGIQVVPGGVIVYSIPNIWYLMDHDGDDRVDERKILYTGFQYKDTHGMVNNFVRSWDGWIHADHGFSNTSTVAGTDQDTIVMNSGNTFRFRLDGSRVEFTTTGRVNPFGYAYDEWGYTYSTDCHTSPVYQLVRGADYPHFGKQPTGIGFGPALMKHTYGSTALAGLDYYIASNFPDEYKNNFYYGDVVLSRVSRSNFKMHGTTPIIQQEEDFIISDDPWFRPVDVKIGPDGALYIADFYNRIIGHYEVPLDHPGRDRQRGRIWRIVYTGNNTSIPEKIDYSTLSLAELIDQLDHPNLPLRMSIADQIVDRFKQSAIPNLQQLVLQNGAIRAQVQSLWMLYRLDGLEEDKFLQIAAHHDNDTLKVHALRIMFEQKSLSPALLAIAESLLDHSNPHVQRQATMVISRYPASTHIEPLLGLLKTSDREDTHFYYSIRQSLRDQIRREEVLHWVNRQNWTAEDAKLLADVMVGVAAPAAGQFLLKHLQEVVEPIATRKRYVEHAALWLPPTAIDQLVLALEPIGRRQADEDYAVFLSMLAGLEQDARPLSPKGKAWANRLAGNFLEAPIARYDGWKSLPIDRRAYPENSWNILDSTDADPLSNKIFLLSGPADGKGFGVSVMYSPAFEMPEKMSFTLLGRKNPPEKNQPTSSPENKVELIVANSGEVLESKAIYDFNTQEKITWEAKERLGQQLQLKITDGSASRGEFVGVGEFVPTIFSFPRMSPQQLVERQLFAAKMSADYNMQHLVPALRQLLDADQADVEVRNESAKALMALNDPAVIPTLDRLLKGSIPLKLKELWLLSLSSHNEENSRAIIPLYLQEIPYQSQQEVVMNLGNKQKGINFLLDFTEKGSINPRLLSEVRVMERLEVIMSEPQQARYRQLVQDAAPPAEDIDAMIQDRLQGFMAADYSIAAGKTNFSSNCGICHQVDGQGGNIGPQLDGIGNWGVRALAEKILDPNRNISKAFTQYTIQLKNGTIKSGLFRREEGQSLVFADIQGKEFSINKNDITERKPSAYTLMPDHFKESISESDFKHLLAYLVHLKSDGSSPNVQ